MMKCDLCDMEFERKELTETIFGTKFCMECLYQIQVSDKVIDNEGLKRRIAELEKTNAILRQQLEEQQGSFW